LDKKIREQSWPFLDALHEKNLVTKEAELFVEFAKGVSRRTGLLIWSRQLGAGEKSFVMGAKRTSAKVFKPFP
jgi:hypothetical protein